MKDNSVSRKNPTFGRLISKSWSPRSWFLFFRYAINENINPILLGVLLVPSFSTLFLELAFIFLRVLSLKMKIPLFAQNKFPSKKSSAFYPYSLWEYSFHCLKYLQSSYIRGTTFTGSMSSFIWKEEWETGKAYCVFLLCRLFPTRGSRFLFQCLHAPY